MMLLLLTQIMVTTTAFRGGGDGPRSSLLSPRSSGAVRLFAEKGFGNKVSRPAPKKQSKAATTSVVVSEEKKKEGTLSQDEIFKKYGVQETLQSAVEEEKVVPAFVDVVPGSIQLGLERFFIGGIVLLLFVFVSIGIGITIDAFAVSSKQPLPEDVRRLIVDVMEPAFTPTLFAGFACSISLGILKTLQLSSDKVQYTEYKED